MKKHNEMAQINRLQLSSSSPRGKLSCSPSLIKYRASIEEGNDITRSVSIATLRLCFTSDWNINSLTRLQRAK